MTMELAQRPPVAERLTPKQWAIMFAVLAMALAPGFFSIPVMDRDEARYSQASVQMLETGNFVDIRFQDQPRHVKPAGTYWAQSITASVFGGADAPIWAFRLPSLIGIFLACAATVVVGSRIGGRSVGVAAGILLGLTLTAAVEARTAKTDALLLASAAFAQGALLIMATRAKDGPPLRFVGAPLVFWAAIGASIMIKGPIVPMVTAATLGVYAVWMRDASVLRRLHAPLGIVVAAAIALPWLILINIQTDGGFIKQAIGHAFLGKVAESDDSHAGPLGYHTLLSPVTLWPSVALLGLGIAAAWSRRAEPVVRFLIAWAVPTWVIFELVATKLPHYVLPAFPAIAILMALGLKDAGAMLSLAWRRWVYWIFVGLFALAAVVVGAAPMIVTAQFGAEPVTAVNVIAVIAGVIAGASGVVLALQPQSTHRQYAAIAAVIVLYWTGFQFAIPRIEPLWPSHRAAQIVHGLQGCETLTTATAGYREPSNVFYLGTDVVLGDGDDAAAVLLNDPQCGVAVVDQSEREAFDAHLAQAGSSVQLVGRVTGVNAVKGRALDLKILIHENSALSRSGDPSRRSE